jgi:hypothetical protein
MYKACILLLLITYVTHTYRKEPVGSHCQITAVKHRTVTGAFSTHPSRTLLHLPFSTHPSRTLLHLPFSTYPSAHTLLHLPFSTYTSPPTVLYLPFSTYPSAYTLLQLPFSTYPSPFTLLHLPFSTYPSPPPHTQVGSSTPRIISKCLKASVRLWACLANKGTALSGAYLSALC